MKLPRVLILWLTTVWLVLSVQPCLGAQSDEANQAIIQAKYLIDTYYGNGENLLRAGKLLGSALAMDDKNAKAYVQMARLTIMGGHIVREEFQKDTLKEYAALIDKALSLDPSNQKAYILKAEAYDLQGNYVGEKAALDRARSLGGSDPWINMGYARYYEKTNNSTSAYSRYSAVEALGPGTDPEQQRAYVQALCSLSQFDAPPGSELTLNALAARAWRDRHPADAWTLGCFADEFIFHGQFDDAIVYAREAVRTMNYGAGRLSLAVGLYGKAAQLIAQNKTSEADKFIVEASAMGFSAPNVMARLQDSSETVKNLMPIIRKIVQ